MNFFVALFYSESYNKFRGLNGDIMDKNYAVHPGLTIKYILISMGKNQKWLSEQMKMSKVVISELINQKRNVTPAIALAFEKATSYSAENLLISQAKFDLYQERMKINNDKSTLQ